MKTKFMVLGSTGFLGTNLTRRLVKTGYPVITFARGAANVPESQHIQGDLRKPAAIKQLLQHKPTVVFCLVGFSGQVASEAAAAESFAVNVVAHKQLLDACAEQLPRTRVIFSSSRLEYGKPRYLPVDEQHPIAPLSAYGRHKHAITKYCQELFGRCGLPVTVFRTSNPYGPHPTGNQRYNIINHMVDQALRSDELIIYGNGAQKRDYLYIDDFLDVFISVLENSASIGEIYNLGSGTGVSFVSAAREIIRCAGSGTIRFRPWPQAEKAVETGDYISDIGKLSRDTLWRPRVSFAEGIAHAVGQPRTI